MTTPSLSPRGAPNWAPRRAHRSSDAAVIGGVASGVAEHLGLPLKWVRFGFLVASAFAGFGVVLYAGLWMMLPDQPHFDDSAPGLAAATRQGKRPGRSRRLVEYGPLVALGAIVCGVLVLVSTLTGRVFAVWPLLIAVAGLAVLWRQADQAQLERWRDSTGRISPLRAVFGDGDWASYGRVAAGLVLVVTAITFFSLRSGDWSTALNVALAAVLGIVGLAFIVGPWLFRLSADLTEERAERVRSQERADVAAHLHDSVLQTLSLIQKSAADPAAVARLARAQERDLRSWLYDGSTAGEPTLAASLRRLAAEVEDSTGVPVEVVCVGDRPLPESARPLVLATREAVLNAARHSGADKVDVYAEVAGDRLEVFVRDRGRGFDPDAIGDDRHGIRDSIVDRMSRHGGSAEIRSTPGNGSEVRLVLPHSDQAVSR